MGMESEPCHKNRHLMPVQSKCAKCTIPTCTNLISELCPPLPGPGSPQSLQINSPRWKQLG